MGNLQELISSLGQIWGKMGKFPREGLPPVPESWSAEKPVIRDPSVENPPVFSPSTSATAGRRSAYTKIFKHSEPSNAIENVSRLDFHKDEWAGWLIFTMEMLFYIQLLIEVQERERGSEFVQVAQDGLPTFRHAIRQRRTGKDIASCLTTNQRVAMSQCIRLIRASRVPNRHHALPKGKSKKRDA